MYKSSFATQYSRLKLNKYFIAAVQQFPEASVVRHVANGVPTSCPPPQDLLGFGAKVSYLPGREAANI